MSHLRLGVAPLLAACFLLATTPATAQGPLDKAGAQAAFDIGKKLMQDGKYAEACPKFEESNRLDPGVGTVLFLADCYERTARTASAWAQFREAEALAARDKDGREKVARERANALEPKLVRMTISVSGTTPGLKVTRDGQDVGSALWNTPVPVDPGWHTVAAAAPKHKEWSTRVQVPPAPGQVTTTQVPALVAAPDEPVAAAPSGSATSGGTVTPPAEPAPSGGTQRAVGLGVAAAGLVGIGIGGVMGLQAKSKLDESNDNDHCRDGNRCDAIGVAARSDARDNALISTVSFIAGGALLVGGAVIFFSAPSSSRRVAITPSFGPGSASLSTRVLF